MTTSNDNASTTAKSTPVSRIDKLTQEQMDMLPVIRDEWLAIGTSCEPLNFEASQAAAKKAYAAAGLEPPKYFFQFDSPMGAALGTAMLMHANDVLTSKFLQRASELADAKYAEYQKTGQYVRSAPRVPVKIGTIANMQKAFDAASVQAIEQLVAMAVDEKDEILATR